MLAAYTPLGLLIYNPVITVHEIFVFSSFSKPVTEFKILRGSLRVSQAAFQNPSDGRGLELQ